MEICLAEPSQRDFIIEAQLAMALETEGLHLDADTVRRGVGAIFDSPSRGFYVVAKRANLPMACTLVLDEWSDWRNGTVWWVHSVYVLPDARRQGVFREIFGWLEHEARGRGIRGIRLYVDKTNTRAQATYSSLGMTDQHYALFEKML